MYVPKWIATLTRNLHAELPYFLEQTLYDPYRNFCYKVRFFITRAINFGLHVLSRIFTYTKKWVSFYLITNGKIGCL